MRLASLFSALLALAGCYSFIGGGLPPHIRTLAVEPFENETSQPVLSTDFQQEMQSELPRNLGVRLAGPAVADAIVRGRIIGYEESVPGIRAGEEGGTVDVVQLEVRVTVDVEIYDLRQDRMLWKNGSVSGVGRYEPDQQSLAGRERAIDQVVAKVIQGAQSQW